MTGDELAHAARSAFAEWLSDVPWGSWATFTYAPTIPGTDRDQNPTVRTARRSMERFLERGTVRAAVWVTERGKRFGRVHNHALIAHFTGPDGAAFIDREEWSAWWRDRVGIVQVEPYNPELGARGYLGKYLTKRDCDWDVWQASNNSRTQLRLLPNGSSQTTDWIRLSHFATRRPISLSANSAAGARRRSDPASAIPQRYESFFVGSKRVTPELSTDPPGRAGICRIRVADWPERST